jgi:glycosyltransferase involved in cell wall biosynthesis/SAM-dependent methyltransferase
VRLAWLTPLPPTASGIADYSFEMLARIAEEASVDAVCPRPARRRDRLSVPPGVGLVDLTDFEGRASSYDAVFYHLGNNPFHEFVYRAAVARPGIAVFHDFVMHHLVGHLTVEGLRDPDRYEALLEAEYGQVGRRLAELRFRGIATDFEKFLFPLSAHVAKLARAIVVHSEGVRERMLEVAPEVPIAVIPHFAQTAPPEVSGATRESARRELGLPEDSFIVGHFGFITRPKQPAAVLGGFSRLATERPDALLLMVGADHTAGLFRGLVEHMDLEDRVRVAGFVDIPTFYRYLRAVDVVVNLRYPSAGEASGTVTRALAEGRAVVVNDVGSFSEIPDDVALKVEIDGNQPEALGDHLIRLAKDPGFRSKMEDSARSYASTTLDIRRCRDMYLDLARGVADGSVRPGPQPSSSRAIAAGAPPIAGASGPRDAMYAMQTRERDLPYIEWLAAESLPPSGVAVQLDLIYRLVLGRPAEPHALREAELALAAGEATRADTVRWIVQSREFHETEIIEKALSDLPRRPGPFTVHAREPRAPGTTERVVEIPWAVSRWEGEQAVLDLGYAYASGAYLTALLGLPIERLYGVDWSAVRVPGMLRAKGDLRALPFRGDALDLVICISTIEHIGMDNARYGLTGHQAEGGDAETLREIERVLRPGGSVLITVPFGKREDQSWFIQYDRGRWEGLVGSTGLKEEEREIFHLTEAGWLPAMDLDTLEQISYGTDAPAARGVLCARLRKPGPSTS